MRAASSFSFLERCIQDPDYGGQTRRCELDYETLPDDPNFVVDIVCTELGGHYTTVSYRADCFEILEDGSVSETPILLYADYNVGSCVASICKDSDIDSQLYKQVEESVRSRLEDGNNQVCQGVEVGVNLHHDNIFSREEDNSRIADVGDVCQDRTIEILEDEKLSPKLEHLNDVASNVPLVDRCFSDPDSKGVARRCELDYSQLEGGDANMAIHQSCESLEGVPVFLSFSVVCLPVLEDGSRGSVPSLFHVDSNVAACIAPICSKDDALSFYKILVEDQIGKKLEAGGSQECNLGSIFVKEPDEDDNIFVRVDEVERSNTGTEGNIIYGTDSFTMMPLPPPGDVDDTLKVSSDEPEIEAKVLLQDSGGWSGRRLSSSAGIVSTGAMLAFSLVL